MRLPEQRLWDTMRGQSKTLLGSREIMLQRIENLTEAGIPDLFGRVKDQKDFWIELKAPTQPANESTRLFRGSSGLNKDQENWALRYSQLGGRWYLVARDSGNELYMFDYRSITEINDYTLAEAKELRLAWKWKGIFGTLARRLIP